MYLALRDKGYPITISEPERVIEDYLRSSKIYRYSWSTQKYYVKSAKEAIEMANRLNEGVK